MFGGHFQPVMGGNFPVLDEEQVCVGRLLTKSVTSQVF